MRFRKETRVYGYVLDGEALATDFRQRMKTYAYKHKVQAEAVDNREAVVKFPTFKEQRQAQKKNREPK